MSAVSEPARAPSLLRLRPEDVGLGLASPIGRQTPTVARVQDRPASEESSAEYLADGVVHHHHEQQMQQLGNHDNALLIDPLVGWFID